jgi:thiamine biosynthesis lipoprotein
MLSSFQPDSEVNRICRSAPHDDMVAIRPDLYAVLTQAQAVSQLSHGAFDVTIGPLSRLWRRARRLKALPDPIDLQMAKDMVGFENIRLSRDAPSVQITKPEIRIDLGGIAKGYAIDKSIELLGEMGIDSALVRGGGDIVVSNPPPGQDHWKVAANQVDQSSPEIVLKLVNQAVSTSGDAFQFLEINGIRYSHLIDPRSGLGTTECVQTTVIAPQATQADALATAASVMDEASCLEMLSKLSGVEACRTSRVADGLRTVKTPGFSDLVADPATSR